MSDHLTNANGAINALRFAALRGNAEAAAELVQIALYATGHVNSLADFPEDHPARTAMDKVVAKSSWWPVQVGAMKEWREPTIPASLGINLPVRIDGRRNLDYRTRTGFALDAMLQISDIIKRDLPPLTADSVTAWIAAAMTQMEDDCQGCFESMPWPQKIMEDADARRDENANMESALRYVVREWIKYGLTQLAKE
jgi:hypothetical protein